MFYFRRYVYIFFILFSCTLSAENGEMALGVGGGGFFPLGTESRDRTVLIHASPTAACSFFFGITDNFDIATQLEWTLMRNISNGESSFNGASGHEYMNYRHLTIIPVVRYNVFPGYPVSPHLFAGAGLAAVTITDREFYIGGKQVPAYNAEDYTVPLLTFTAGVDVVWRLPWWYLFVKSSVSVTGHRRSMSIESRASVGFYWFFASLY